MKKFPTRNNVRPFVSRRLVVTSIAGAAVAAAWFWSERDDPLGLSLAIWAVLAAWGVFNTLWTVRDTWQERAALAKKKGADKVALSIGTGNIWRAFLLLMACASLLIVAVGLIVAPPNALVNRLMIAFMAFMLVCISIADRIERLLTDYTLHRQRSLRE